MSIVTSLVISVMLGAIVMGVFIGTGKGFVLAFLAGVMFPAVNIAFQLVRISQKK